MNHCRNWSTRFRLIARLVSQYAGLGSAKSKGQRFFAESSVVSSPIGYGCGFATQSGANEAR